jgi:NAD(P)-dependent dehydrogenase (short-subunit alcohol dehydrogenase family)
MTGRLTGRVAIVTGAGRGLGRAHALRLAAEGASVVVNDLGMRTALGEGRDSEFAKGVVSEIIDAGGRATASGHDIADWHQAGELVGLAISAFGDLHILVNNAGIAAITPIVDTTQEEWDRIGRVHLDGHAGMTHHALRYWRSRAEEGHDPRASIIHTSSPAAFFAGPDMAHYDAAKAAIAAFSRVVSIEAAAWGVRSNALVPLAHTRMWEDYKTQFEGPIFDDAIFDRDNPANISPLVAWLAAPDCPANRQTIYIYGDHLWVLDFPVIVHALETDGRWTLDELDRQLAGRLVISPTDPALPLQEPAADPS